MMRKERENLQGGTQKINRAPSAKFLPGVGGPKKAVTSSSVLSSSGSKESVEGTPQPPHFLSSFFFFTFPSPITNHRSPWELILQTSLSSLHSHLLVFGEAQLGNYPPHPMFDGGRCGSSMPCTFITVIPRG